MSATKKELLFKKLNTFIQTPNNIFEDEALEKTLIELLKLRTRLKSVASKELPVFLEFGQWLIRLHQDAADAAQHKLRGPIHQYLNFLRTPSLLQSIYKNDDTNKWCTLMVRLVEISDFTTGELFLQRKLEYNDRPLFKTVRGKKVTSHTWGMVHRKVQDIARGLISLTEGDFKKNRVAILSENSLEMVCIDLACLMIGLVNIPLPTNTTTQNIEFILDHSKTTIIFVSNSGQYKEIVKIKNNLPRLKEIIGINFTPEVKNENFIDYQTFLDFSKNIGANKVKKFIENVKPADLATIMYTSGTTQQPKGIMFSQLNLVSKRFARALALPEIGDNDRFICYLPLFHTFGRYFEMMGCIFWGAIYIFLENPKIETMISTMVITKPTVLISIPKKWMQFYEKAQEKIDIYHAPLEEIKPIVEKLTGGKLKWGLSAAGYLSSDIFRFFQNVGIELMSGFGMTEATGGITMTPFFQYKENSVGKTLPGIQIKLGKDNEMFIKGPYVMMGYLNEKIEGFEKGWLHTGDIFTEDRNGFYEIIDRKKEIYKNIRGETISPQKIENLFRDFDSIKSIFLVGDHRAYNTILIYPDYEYEQLNLKKISLEKLREFVSSLIVSVNQFLAPYERIVDFSIIDRDFSSSFDELTAKGTFKRKNIEHNFSEQIEKMYLKNYIGLHLDDFEIRIPTWFLRQKALTSDDITIQDKAITITPLSQKLQVEIFNNDSVNSVRIGDLVYQTSRNHITLNNLINYPALWLGNLELAEFVGLNIFKFNREEMLDEEIIVEPCKNNFIETDARKKAFVQKESEQTADTATINIAAFMLQTWQEEHALTAIAYLEKILRGKNESAHDLAWLILTRAAFCENDVIKKAAFQTLLLNEKRDGIQPILDCFFKNDSAFLDDASIAAISVKMLTRSQLTSLVDYLSNFLESYLGNREKLTTHQIIPLLKLITSHGINHPIVFKRVRTELAKWCLSPIPGDVQEQATKCFVVLQRGFRHWLGANFQIAIDPETDHEISWQDVISFDDGVPEKHRERLTAAITNTSLIREAIFIFSNGKMVQLPEIAQNGVWISLLGSKHGKSVYRISVQTHHLGTFDLAINLNEDQTTEEIEAEINWMICAGATEFDMPLVEDFGGFWPEYSLWTEEFVSGKTVELLLKQLDTNIKPEKVEKIQQLWPSFVWNGLSAYIDFWKRTGKKIVISIPSPANVIVPSYDFQVGFRIISISYRKEFDGILEMIKAFKKHYVETVESKYEVLKGMCNWPVIFSAFLEIFGEVGGLKLLQDAVARESGDVHDKLTKSIVKSLEKFICDIQETGYRPERLHFAIQRYKRWHLLNPEATPHARIQTLRDLYITYTLAKTEKKYPGSRIHFFRDTVFADSSPQVIAGLNAVSKGLKVGNIGKYDLADEFAELRHKHHLNDAELYFLTRLSYPHLSATDSAEFISLNTEGTQKTALVVFFEDEKYNQYSIRKPANPKEIARLHRLFNLANLPVEFKPDHEFLVVLNDRSLVVGGLFYRPIDEKQMHLEKVVVDEHNRKSRISDGLVNEFFKRIQTDGIEIVTVGFLRPEYFRRFGFTTDHRYGNLVKKLDKTPPPEEPKDDFIESLIQT